MSRPAGVGVEQAQVEVPVADQPAAPLGVGRSRQVRRAVASSPALMAAVLIVLIAVFTLLRPHSFPTTFNANALIINASIYIVMASSMTYVMIAGGFDISIGSILVFSDVIAAKAMNSVGDHGAWTIVLGTVVAVVVGTLWGVFNGVCITVLRVPALITTLGTLGAALGAAQIVTGGVDVRDVPQSVTDLSTGKLLGVSWLVWTAVVVAAFSGLVLTATRFGRHTYVIGSNAEAGRRAGLQVNRHIIGLYAFSGATAGLAGMMALIRFTTTDITGHTNDSLTVITAVALGGTSLFGGVGTVVGSALGVFVPTVLNNGLIITGVQPFYQQFSIGLVLIVAVYVDQLKRRQRDQA